MRPDPVVGRSPALDQHLRLAQRVEDPGAIASAGSNGHRPGPNLADLLDG